MSCPFKEGNYVEVVDNTNLHTDVQVGDRGTVFTTENYAASGNIEIKLMIWGQSQSQWIAPEALKHVFVPLAAEEQAALAMQVIRILAL